METEEKLDVLNDEDQYIVIPEDESEEDDSRVVIDEVDDDGESGEPTKEGAGRDDDTVTRIVAQRLKPALAAKDRIIEQLQAQLVQKQQAEEQLAKARGYTSHEDLLLAEWGERLAEAQAENDTTKVKTIVAEMQRREADKVQIQQEQNRLWFDAQLAALREIDPSIKTMDDLVQMPNFDKFDRLARKGIDFVDAYTAANPNKIRQQTAEAVRNHDKINAQSKQHLRTTKTTVPPSTVTIPKETYAVYKKMGMSDKEIKAHYAKYLKENQ